MAKSMRCKREKRLRAIRRDMVEPYYEKKDEAKLAAQEAALAAPKLPVKSSSKASSSMEFTPVSTSTPSDNGMDVEMADGSQTKSSLKPFGGVGKKSQRVFKVGKRRRHGKGKGSKVKRRHI
ncbi:uncharacterized protein LOC126789297 [Argentina anserina]|uniref:uncharacterized protein LOC126789297 n=1 Tax=Argentina anserina TaxID=57926 RepID=UPI002176864F|nr:uncharacterized protein LOC126789297 [Potentilla anserina]